MANETEENKPQQQSSAQDDPKQPDREPPKDSEGSQAEAREEAEKAGINPNKLTDDDEVQKKVEAGDVKEKGGDDQDKAARLLQKRYRCVTLSFLACRLGLGVLRARAYLTLLRSPFTERIRVSCTSILIATSDDVYASLSKVMD